MKIAGTYFNPDSIKIFQKSLRALFHSPLHLFAKAEGWGKQLISETLTNHDICNNRVQYLFYHSITKFVFILINFWQLKEAISHFSLQNMVQITHEQNIICTSGESLILWRCDFESSAVRYRILIHFGRLWSVQSFM